MSTSLADIKKELANLSQQELLGMCARLAKYKKENKELLSYLLFESHDEAGFVNKLKQEMDLHFSKVNRNNLYLARKGIRKILRIVQKNIKFSGSSETEAELMLHFCLRFKESGLASNRNKALQNLYLRLITRIDNLLGNMHEDFRADFQSERNLL